MKMSEAELNKLKYPVGTFQNPDQVDESLLAAFILDIESFAERMEVMVQGLDPEQLQWQYRPDGWNIKQVVHHCADSHMNAFIRFKLTLTEDSPTIKPYYEDKWAELADGNANDINMSLTLLLGLHKRWAVLLKSLTSADLEKTFTHPEHGRKITLKENIGMYAWHSNHHLSHVKNALIFKNKFLKDS